MNQKLKGGIQQRGEEAVKMLRLNDPRLAFSLLQELQLADQADFCVQTFVRMIGRVGNVHDEQMSAPVSILSNLMIDLSINESSNAGVLAKKDHVRMISIIVSTMMNPPEPPDNGDDSNRSRYLKGCLFLGGKLAYLLREGSLSREEENAFWNDVPVPGIESLISHSKESMRGFLPQIGFPSFPPRPPRLSFHTETVVLPVETQSLGLFLEEPETSLSLSPPVCRKFNPNSSRKELQGTLEAASISSKGTKQVLVDRLLANGFVAASKVKSRRTTKQPVGRPRKRQRVHSSESDSE